MFITELDDNDFMEALKKKAQPYFQRGYDAVIKQRPLRTFDEAADIIKARFLEHGIDETWAEPFTCVFARCYIAGVVAAARLVAPDIVAELEAQPIGVSMRRAGV